MKRLTLLSVMCIVFFSCTWGRGRNNELLSTVNKTLDFCLQQSKLMAESLKDKPDELPKTINEKGELVTCRSSWWVSGFFPGQLWYMYEFSKDEKIKYLAEVYSARVADQQYTTNNHDVGFMIFCSYGNGYRLTKNEEYLSVINNAARSLSTRFNQKIGCIRSWDRTSWNDQWKYAVIIDNMMNLELLMWASKKFNEPKFSKVAISHANTTLKNHFREDGSSFHVVSYDTISGEPELKHTAQGYSHSSAWARGQAWGLYGYTMMFRETKDENYLKKAMQIADFIIDNPNIPEDKIPYWDFNAPDIPIAKRDASAGAIMCSAFIELSQLVDKKHSKKYLDIAEKQLYSLCSDNYMSKPGENGNFILKHSVGHMPNKSEADVPLTYADYYFVEALMRYRNLTIKKKDESFQNIKLSEIGKGWSNNSVNATIFRKNSVVSSKKYQFVAYYDSTSTVVISRRKHGSDKWEIYPTQYKGNVNDAHNVICIMVDGDGYIHMSWDHHNNPLRYCRSLQPEIPKMGKMQPMIGEQENVVTYPEFFRLANGDLLFTYRDGGSGNGNLVMNKYDLKSYKWSRIQSNLLDGEGQRNAYWQMVTDKNRTIHISWVWRETPDVKSNHDMCYACSEDNGKTWKKSDGAAYSLPIDSGNAEIVCSIPQNSNLINQTSMATDKNGNPYIATYFKGENDSCTQFYVIYKDKSIWKTSLATERKLDFELGGEGSRSIPVSRPQLLVDDKKKSRKLYLIFRDEEKSNNICLSTSEINGKMTWATKIISPYPVERWEPSFDTELWRTDNKLHLYFQKVGQGQGETSVTMGSQMVGVLEIF